MAATSVAPSSFSPSIHALKCTQTRLICTSESLLKLPPSARMMLAPMSLSCSVEQVSPLVVSWRCPRVLSAAVAQEEAAATAPVEENLDEGEEQVAAEGEGEGEVEATGDGSTKLYFGNLPYNVDSAQLAGIIQEYGSPELIEVLYDRVTGKSRGFAFVTMSSIEDCNAVIDNLGGSVGTLSLPFSMCICLLMHLSGIKNCALKLQNSKHSLFSAIHGPHPEGQLLGQTKTERSFISRNRTQALCWKFVMVCNIRKLDTSISRIRKCGWSESSVRWGDRKVTWLWLRMLLDKIRDGSCP
uniref:Uncharacterized protein MANES_15G045900 n=1 Tax=Rhizophora mucronata TaxID=61149 RepID=A0A2P2JD96_RHIMU